MAFLQGTKALEKWCRIVTEKYDQVNVVNMTTSWRSGLGFCAIIHHFRPELIEFESLDEEDILGNNQLAFSVAEQHLGIPALLDPHDMAECELLDRLSILTYLSQFYQAFHGATTPANAPKPGRTSSSRSSSATSSPSKTIPRVPVIGKRTEPCRICNQSVFILERLNVGGKLLHRTCFKCARCQTQLNIVAYYETEAGDYCCDMCPDEEKNQEAVVEANKKMVEEHLDSGVEGSSEDEEVDKAKTEESKAESKIYPDISSVENNNIVEEKADENSNQTPSSKVEEAREESSDKDDNEISKTLDIQADDSSPNVEETSQAVEVTDDANNNEEKDIVEEVKVTEVIEDKVEVKAEGNKEEEEEEEEELSENNPFACDDEQDGEAENEPEKSEREPSPGIEKETTNEPDEVPEIQIAESSDLAEDKEGDGNPTNTNPFGDDDDDEDEEEEATKGEGASQGAIKKTNSSTNPFGSDLSDEEDDDNQASAAIRNVPKAQSTPVTNPPPKPPRATSVVAASNSLNPFGSDFEDDEEDQCRTPSRLPPSPTPSSASSVRSWRKKRQAPQPPGKPSPVARRSLQPTAAPRSSITPNTSFRESSPVNTAKSARFRPAPPRPPPPPSSSELQKQQKERDNFNRRSLLLESSSIASSSADAVNENGIVLTPLSPDKASADGMWKKKKGPAPPRPIPQKRQVRKIPRKAVNTELHDIEIKQQELERQGVKLERTIRDCCEKNDQERSEQGLDNNDRDSLGPEVEDLIIQLFDLVNEKNDLFRRQTELMYMKRDFRLEEEHADIEHQIRVLMNKPESQKTPEDAAGEEKLITRLMEIVSQRNEIVDCLEMDRLRELEEDESFETHMGEYAAIKPTEDDGLKKKLKKKKEKKKKKKDKNFDADKDIDTSEYPNGSPKASPKKVSSEKDKAKKLKKKILSSIMATSLKKT